LGRCLIYIMIFLSASQCRAFGITIAEEEEMSRKFLKIVMKNFEIIDDPFIVDYVTRTGGKILSAFPPQPFEYNFYIIKQHSYNAFAIPGGHIFINSGLIKGMENEQELAGILAHEISHVHCRHISRRIERGTKISFLTAAGLLAGIFLGPGMGAAASNALVMGSMATGQSLMLAHSREHEMQADQIGLKYLMEAGYSGAGLLAILKKMRDKRWLGPDQLPAYLTTHPAVEDRMAYLETQLKSNPGENAQTDNSAFEKARTRIIALYADTRVALNKFKRDIRIDPENAMANYGYGLALVRVGQDRQGEEFLIKALERKSFDANILIDLGRVYYLRGDYSEALEMLEGALTMEPENIEGLFFQGRVHLELKNYDKAVKAIQGAVASRQDYKNVVYLLGKLHGKKNNMGKAHYYLGIHHKKEEEWTTAAFHLNRAMEKAVDVNKREEIEKLLKEVRKKGLVEKRRLEEEAKNKNKR